MFTHKVDGYNISMDFFSPVSSDLIKEIKNKRKTKFAMGSIMSHQCQFLSLQNLLCDESISL